MHDKNRHYWVAVECVSSTHCQLRIIAYCTSKKRRNALVHRLVVISIPGGGGG